ncbi:hypothetical protein CH330_09635, partial [candidate division WOR-3 bacterium JGI_Cruoil_03_51_56]
MLVALTVLIAAGFVFAEWQPVGNGTGSAKITMLEQNAARTVFEVTVPGVEITPVVVEGEQFSQLTLPGEV